MQDLDVNFQLFGGNIKQLPHECRLNFLVEDSFKRQKSNSKNKKLNTSSVFRRLKYLNNLTETESSGKSDQVSINDVITTYNKTIQLMDDECKVKNICKHKFLQCNVCSNCYLKLSEDYSNTFTLFNNLNGLAHNGDENAAAIVNLKISKVTELRVTTHKDKFLFEKGIEEKNLSCNGIPATSIKFSTIPETVSELACLKMGRCNGYLKYLAKLHSIVKNIKDAREYVKEEEMDVDRKPSSESTLNDIMELDYELLTFLVTYLQDYSHNKTGLLINILEKIDTMEQSMILEFLLFVKQFAENIKTNYPKPSEVPDLSVLTVLYGQIHSSPHNPKSIKNEDYYLDEAFGHCQAVESVKTIAFMGKGENLSGSDLNVTSVDDGILEDFTVNYDSFSNYSEESNADIIFDCEEEPIRLPQMTCFFITYSDLKKPNIELLYKLALRMKFGISKEYIEATTTHLIIPEEWQPKIFPYQYLAAIAHQSLIVTFKWVEDCLEADRIFPTTPYIPNLPGALSCLNKDRKPLFEEYFLYIHCPEELQIKEQSQHLAEACGATVVSDILDLYRSRSKNKKTILVSGRSPNSDLLLQCVNLGIYPVHLSWIHDSIIEYLVQPLEHYCLINSLETNIELFL
ncbi:uncharacterized protein isoform X2 [Rhodnius prolixus]|uniref:uncharacterized protein isoform X2 n=1 Tax=Rhodnius prolixus TaxID=13249 RepID=UPI003D18A622